MLNVSNIINEYIEEKITLPFTIENDVISSADGDAACLRYDPAPAAERRYIDGTRLLKWNLAYYIRAKNRGNARKWAYIISELLDGATLTDSSTGTTVDTEAQTLPQFVSVDDKNNSIYTVAVIATYLTNEG